MVILCDLRIVNFFKSSPQAFNFLNNTQRTVKSCFSPIKSTFHVKVTVENLIEMKIEKREFRVKEAGHNRSYIPALTVV